MRPTDTYNLRKANVVVWVGEGLTPWFEGPIDYLSPTARQIELLGSPETQMPAFCEVQALESIRIVCMLQKRSTMTIEANMNMKMNMFKVILMFGLIPKMQLRGFM